MFGSPTYAYCYLGLLSPCEHVRAKNAYKPRGTNANSLVRANDATRKREALRIAPGYARSCRRSSYLYFAPRVGLRAALREQFAATFRDAFAQKTATDRVWPLAGCEVGGGGGMSPQTRAIQNPDTTWSCLLRQRRRRGSRLLLSTRKLRFSTLTSRLPMHLQMPQSQREAQQHPVRLSLLAWQRLELPCLTRRLNSMRRRSS